MGTPGADSLVQTSPVEPGEICPGGGVKVDTGLDADADGELSNEELAAGSSTVICSVDNAGECGEPLALGQVSGTAQTFIVDRPSAALTVDLNTTEGVELKLAGEGFTSTPGTAPGEFSITPHLAGGPFDLALIASDGCSVDVASFTIERVEPNTVPVRTVGVYSPWRDVDLAYSGSSEALLTVDYLETSVPTPVALGEHTFDVLDAAGNFLVTTGPFEAKVHEAYSYVTYADANGDFATFALVDDAQLPAQGARLRAVNLDTGAAAIDIMELGRNTPLFSALDLATPSAATEVSTTSLGLTLSDANGTYDYRFDAGLFDAGTVANLYVYDDEGRPNVLVQYLDEHGTSETGEAVNLPNESFEGADLPSYACEGNGGWEITTDSATAGSQSAKTPYLGYLDSNWIELNFFVPERGTISFDWQTATADADALVYCVDRIATPCEYSTAAYIACSPDNNDGTIGTAAGWQAVTTAPMDAGMHSIRWRAYDAANHAWLDNIRYTPESP
jgi:hypothetical protein